MSETWYETSTWGELIRPVQVVSHTEKFVQIAGAKRRVAKVSEWNSYWQTWDQAKAYLLAKAEEEVRHARLRLEAATGKYGNVKGLKRPDSAGDRHE